METWNFSRRHAIGFLLVGVIDLVAAIVGGTAFGFSIQDILLLKADATGLFVIGGYVLVLFGVYLLFVKDKAQ